MKKIDTTSWKEFRVGDLFDKLDLKLKKDKFVKTRDVSLKKTDEYNLPLVNAKHFNNGIMYYGRETDFEYAEMTIDIVANGAASTGDVYPQPQKTGVLIDAYLIKAKKRDLSEYVLYFLSTVIERCIKKKYSYDDKCVWNKVKDEKIYLPAKNEDPDWQYMEDYMRQIELRAQISISAFSDNNYSNISVNTAYWKEFKIGDLFPTINKPKVYHTREVVEDSYGIPYIVRSKFNNGIKCRIKPDGLVCSPKGVITFGAENAAFFYQKEEWCGGRDIYYIDTRNIKHYACMFLVACLNQITEKYTYNFGLFPDLLKQESIKLPATPSGEPDWHYMEMYMRGVEAIVKNKLSLLVPHKSEVAIKDAANVTFNNATVTYIDQSKTYNVKK